MSEDKPKPYVRPEDEEGSVGRIEPEHLLRWRFPPIGPEVYKELMTNMAQSLAPQDRTELPYLRKKD